MSERSSVDLALLPKQSFIEIVLRACTRAMWLLRRPFLLHRVRQPVIETIAGRPFLLLPEVQNPVVFRSGAFFAEMLAKCDAPLPGARALDLGTGSGICAIFAAQGGYEVVAVDLNPKAVRCARMNAILNQLEGSITVRYGDLFAPVLGEKFDLVLFNPPFFRGEPKDLFDMSWRSADVFERFAAGLQDALTSDGRALILLSTDGEAEAMLAALKAHHFHIDVFARRNFYNEVMTIYSARPIA